MLMRTVSGIRGIVGEGLTPESLIQHVYAFLQVTKAKKIAVGRDSRVTGPAIERFVSSICELAGVDVISMGLATTPTVEMAVETQDCDGGIIITASHNPAEWNALKFLAGDGTFLVQKQVEELLEIADAGQFTWVGYDKIGQTTTYTEGDKLHVDGILNLPFIDVDLIRSKKYKVAVDAVNGAGSFIFTQLLKELGCEVEELYVKPDGLFPRGAEPVPESLVDLGKVVKSKGCVVGFASDPDSDRCALVSEAGRPVGEEYTLAMATDLILSNQAGNVAINLSTSRMIDEVASRYDREVFRTKVGEINVTEVIREKNCVIGGEGNGGVILPALHCGRDGVLAAAMTLQWLAEKDQTIEEFVSSLKPYVMTKGKVSVDGLDIDAVFTKLKESYAHADLSTLDGLRIDLPEGWLHVRKSNTEPIVRVMAESAEPGVAEKLQKEASDIIASLG